ncbi:hypothetical protein M409DRAFT_61751 [Zasmidium cellare ATCC 36951]|uniref:Zn(2)-C6 fungal-type domain-containing protein n=1 Tax=Zasmidium cellare ATCC 36951 TaxID=1080233 RepID=A0A6A6BUG2_ZASCE|nr:uncharacterized protein M409DRAFT_61751 [Zasmidium cellare ATCC 36951]KAF2158335.1 hypothetical protein M409DRAFT_61751 [Zasmidium cellare ATCC 36951]
METLKSLPGYSDNGQSISTTSGTPSQTMGEPDERYQVLATLNRDTLRKVLPKWNKDTCVGIGSMTKEGLTELGERIINQHRSLDGVNKLQKSTLVLEGKMPDKEWKKLSKVYSTLASSLGSPGPQNDLVRSTALQTPVDPTGPLSRSRKKPACENCRAIRSKCTWEGDGGCVRCKKGRKLCRPGYDRRRADRSSKTAKHSALPPTMQIHHTDENLVGGKPERTQDVSSARTSVARATQTDNHYHLQPALGTPHRSTEPSIIGASESLDKPSEDRLSMLHSGPPRTAVTGYARTLRPLYDANINPQQAYGGSLRPGDFNETMYETNALPELGQPMMPSTPAFHPVHFNWEDPCGLLLADIAQGCWRGLLPAENADTTQYSAYGSGNDTMDHTMDVNAWEQRLYNPTLANENEGMTYAYQADTKHPREEWLPEQPLHLTTGNH